MKVPIADLVGQFEPFREDALAAVREVIESARFIQNRSVRELERRFAAMHKKEAALGVSSGTAALSAALMASNIGPGDEVVVPAFTFIATANVVKHTGATPLFADIDPDTFNIDPTRIWDRMTQDTRAVMPVHLFGQMAPMREIYDMIGEEDPEHTEVTIIEDAAQSHLAEQKATGEEPYIGTYSHMACFSMYPGKNLPAFGDGGMVVTNDLDLEAILRQVSNNGIPVEGPKYLNERTGLNFRLNELTAAIMLVYIDHLREWTKQRQMNATRYGERLADVEQVTCPVVRDGNVHVYNQFVIRAERRDELQAHLREKEVQTAVFYPIPLPLLPAYADLGHSERDFPVAEKASKEVLALPIGPHLREEQIDFVCEQIREFYAS